MHLLGLRTLSKSIFKRFISHKNQPPWSVLFFGNDDFSLYSLKALCDQYRNNKIINRLEVVTSVKGKANPVQKYAFDKKLKVHPWPVDVRDKEFDVGLVVSFGYLIPEEIINKFEHGMLNVHASLLPRWRGAAPIIYAIANDDKQSGVTIMRIKPKKFDIGDIIAQKSVPITNEMRMPALHQKLGNLGAEILVSTLDNLEENLRLAQPQSNEHVTLAPKVGQDFAQIDWGKTSREIYNLERSITGFLTPYTTWDKLTVKLYNIKESDCECNLKDIKPGFVFYDKTDKLLKVLCGNRTWVSVEKIGVYGKKVMKAVDFSNGFVNKQEISARYFK